MKQLNIDLSNMNIFFLLPLLATMAITVPVNPGEPSVANSTIANVVFSSTPISVKFASLLKSDQVQIPHSKELDEESDESGESGESDESDESNETSESQNSKEVFASHHTNETKTVQSSKDSADVSAPPQKIKPHFLSPNLDKTTLSVELLESDATTVSVSPIRDATFLPSTLEPNASTEVPLYLKPIK